MVHVGADHDHRGLALARDADHGLGHGDVGLLGDDGARGVEAERGQQPRGGLRGLPRAKYVAGSTASVVRMSISAGGRPRLVTGRAIRSNVRSGLSTTTTRAVQAGPPSSAAASRSIGVRGGPAVVDDEDRSWARVRAQLAARSLSSASHSIWRTRSAVSPRFSPSSRNVLRGRRGRNGDRDLPFAVAEDRSSMRGSAAAATRAAPARRPPRRAGRPAGPRTQLPSCSPVSCSSSPRGRRAAPTDADLPRLQAGLLGQLGGPWARDGAPGRGRSGRA